MSDMTEHLNRTDAQLHEVLGDVSGDPDLVRHIVHVTEDLSSIDRLVTGMTAAMVEEATEGPVDLLEMMRSAFLFGLASGITYERRGYKL